MDRFRRSPGAERSETLIQRSDQGHFFESHPAGLVTFITLEICPSFRMTWSSCW